MASINKLPSGTLASSDPPKVNTPVRERFDLKSDASRWAAEQETRLDRGATVSKRLSSSGATLAHMADMAQE